MLKTAYQLDKARVRQSFAAAASRYDSLAGLQRQVGETLLAKFPLTSGVGRILDIGCGTGFLTGKLAQAADNQAIVALDIALPMLHACRANHPATAITPVCGDAEKLPFGRQSFQQIYSNLALQWCQDLAAVLSNCQQLLEANGRLVFATFGPATLQELKTAWRSVDNYTHVNEFYSTAEIDGFLRQAGFRRVHLETAHYKTSYSSVLALMRELKGLGAHNVNLHKNPKVTTRHELQQMIGSYVAGMPDSEVYATYEIIFVEATI